jgi:RsmE family RNA methyltransferase
MYIYKKDLLNLKFSNQDFHIKSLRPKVGQNFYLTNLIGEVALISVVFYDYKTATGDYIIVKKFTKPTKLIEKIVIQIQTDKLYLEKMCEILPIANVSKIFIVRGDFSPKQDINFDRLNSILIRSCEQSENPNLPKLEFVKNLSEIENLIIQNNAVVMELPNKNSTIQKQEKKIKSCVISGPEGGFSKKEIDYFNSLSLNFVSLDNHTVGVLPAWLSSYSYFVNTPF